MTEMMKMSIKEYAKYYKTEENLFKELKNAKSLTKQQLRQVIFWKSPRNLKQEKNSEEDVINKTIDALSKTVDEEKIKTLCDLKGIGVAIASAILTMVNPEKYGIIDFHAWRALYKEKKESFTKKDYIKYLKEIQKTAKEENITPREIDKGLLIKDAKVKC